MAVLTVVMRERFINNPHELAFVCLHCRLENENSLLNEGDYSNNVPVYRLHGGCPVYFEDSPEKLKVNIGSHKRKLAFAQSSLGKRFF